MIQAKVREWAEHHALLPQGGIIVAACSGGPDSLALVDLLDQIQQESEISLVVAHFDHGLRGDVSRLDAEFVGQFCETRGISFYKGEADVRAVVRCEGGSTEEVSRRLRYEFLRKIAAKVGGALIATGHHRDDQAETLLLNLIRGSGGRGLGAMRPRQGDIVRPLLCLNRDEILTYCLQRNLLPRIDASNHDVKFRRNRVRHELVPLLQQRFNPALTGTLCRTADILADENEFLREFVRERQTEWVAREDEGFRLCTEVFSNLHAAVQRELLLCLLEQLRGNIRGITFRHVEQIRHLFLRDQGEKQIKLPGGWRARKSYANLFIEAVKSEPEGIKPLGELNIADTKERADVFFPGDTMLPEFGFILRTAVLQGEIPESGNLGAMRAAFDLCDLKPPLFVRRRQAGDVFRPLGAPGARKLKKLLIDLKIPLSKREELPIVCDSAGILWVAGWRRSERGKLSPQTEKTLMMELIRI